jgi:DNA replication and repair protein RecF
MREFIKQRNEQVVCSLKKGKSIKTQRQSIDKFSDHIGFIPLVIISPADRDLIVEAVKPDGNSWIASSHS